jgi:multiple sugar transport system permease protein
MAPAGDNNKSVRPGELSPAGFPSDRPFRVRVSEWLDHRYGTIFIFPAVVMILIFSIFPLAASLIIAFSRIRLRGGGYQVRFVGLKNFAKQVTGSEQFHFLGSLKALSLFGWIFSVVVIAIILWMFVRWMRARFNVLGFIGRLFLVAVAIGLTLMIASTVLSGSRFGTLGTTLFYVFAGSSVQFLIGLGLAFLCSQPIRGKTFFRVVFFVPLMITPIGIGYAFRMMADTTKGPFAPVWQWAGLGDFAWAADAWTARIFIVIGDSWQWIPFIFVVLLAGLENVSRDHVEAAEVDGAGRWQIFREITWPQIAPVAATVMLIRVIEAFKIVDLPNIMTSGGPGIATESMSLHSLFAWRSLDLGQSAAIAYLLLFVTVVMCVSFFNLVVLDRVRNK